MAIEIYYSIIINDLRNKNKILANQLEMKEESYNTEQINAHILQLLLHLLNKNYIKETN